DLSQADDAEEMVAKLMTGGAVVTVPDAAGQLPCGRRDRARQRDDGSDHQLRDGVRVFAGKADNRDSAPACRIRVNVVDAARSLRDELQARRALDHAPGDPV